MATYQVYSLIPPKPVMLITGLGGGCAIYKAGTLLLLTVVNTMVYKTAVKEPVLERTSGSYPTVIAAMSRTSAFLQADRYTFLHPEELVLHHTLNDEKARYSDLIERWTAKRTGPASFFQG